MFELASALFSIADANEFRFARFYIVCEEVPLGTPESPPIVSGVSDMHPSDCPNVEETRNQMQNLSGRNPHIFLHRMVQAYFHSRTCQCFYLHIITLTPARSALSGRPFFVHIYFLIQDLICYIVF